MNSTTVVIESYKNLLEIKYPSQYQNYCRRLNENNEAAKAEAIVFSLLRNTVDQITLAEDVSTGGVDFLCISNQNQFMVEGTALEAESVATQSGRPNVIIDGTCRIIRNDNAYVADKGIKQDSTTFWI